MEALYHHELRRHRGVPLSRVERGKTTSARTTDVYDHAFMRARSGELNISWDRVDDQSQIGHRVTMSFADRRRG